MSDKLEAVSVIKANVRPEQLYDAWLDPVKIRVWLASSLREMGLAGDIESIEIDAKEGGAFVMSDYRDGNEARHWGTYRVLDRPRCIEFTWITDPADEADPSVVTLTIEPEGEGCVARVVHVIDAKWGEYAPRIAASWERMVRHAALTA